MRIIVSIIGMIAALGSSAALACSCVGRTREEAFRGAGLIFDGVIESISVRPGGQDEEDDFDVVGRTATFRVEREIKGVGELTRIIDYNIETGGNCGMSFEKGKRYRVFAYEYEGRWGTSSCSFTTELLLAPDNRKNRAVISAENYAKANPDDPLAHWLPDRIRSEIDDEYFIRAYLKKVEVGDDTDFNQLNGAFETAFNARDLERAENIARRAVARFSGESDAHLMLAKALHEEGKLAEALDAAVQAAALDPISVDAVDEFERLRFLVRGEATPGRRDYRNLYAKKLSAPNCVAPRADFSDSAFGEADFSGARLESNRFRGLVSGKTSFRGAHLSGARFDEAGKYSEFASSKRVHGFAADFSKADLRRASFSKAEFSSADFDGADLSNADFTTSTIEKATFAGARLSGSRFSGTKFYSTSMDNASLGTADFSNAEVVNVSWRGVDMRRAKFDGADLRGGVIDCKTKLPRGFVLKGSGVIPEQAVCGGKKQSRDFSKIKWRRMLNVQGFNLASADFSGGDFFDAAFQNANLAGADFSDTEGIAYFSGADLSHASFRNASILPVVAADWYFLGRAFGDAKLDGTDFSGALLTASAFLSRDDRVRRFTVDLSTAIFDGAELHCLSDSYRAVINRYEKLLNSPEESSGAKAGVRATILGIEKRNADEAHAYLAAEGEVVRFLAARWQTLRLDEACKSYLNAAASPGGAP
ncbi:MAG: pentapeptide repeat-containing protein [Parvularculaceae bacterium]